MFLDNTQTNSMFICVSSQNIGTTWSMTFIYGSICSLQSWKGLRVSSVYIRTICLKNNELTLHYVGRWDGQLKSTSFHWTNESREWFTASLIYISTLKLIRKKLILRTFSQIRRTFIKKFSSNKSWRRYEISFSTNYAQIFQKAAQNSGGAPGFRRMSPCWPSAPECISRFARWGLEINCKLKSFHPTDRAKINAFTRIYM